MQRQTAVSYRIIWAEVTIKLGVLCCRTHWNVMWGHLGFLYNSLLLSQGRTISPALPWLLVQPFCPPCHTCCLAAFSQHPHLRAEKKKHKREIVRILFSCGGNIRHSSFSSDFISLTKSSKSSNRSNETRVYFIIVFIYSDL